MEWIALVSKKAPNPILYGFSGFLVIGIVSVFIPLMLQFIILNLGLAAYNVSLYFIISIASYGAAIILFLWLGTRTRYESNFDLI